MVPAATRMDDTDGRTIDVPEPPAPRRLEDPVDFGNGLSEIDRVEIADLGAGDATKRMIGRQVVAQAME